MKKNKKKLNIAVIMQSPDIGGAEIYMISLIEKFSNLGHNVRLFTNQGKFYHFANGKNIQVFKIPFILDIMNFRGLMRTLLRLPRALYYYKSLLRNFKKQEINLILMSGFTEKLFVSFLAQFYKIPVVWIEYGPLQAVFSRNFHIPQLFYHLLINIPKRVIVPTENTKKSIIKVVNISLDKLKVIPCGIEMPKKMYYRKNVSKMKKIIVVGNVSRLTREKGQEYFIKAIPEVLKANPNVRFLLIGDGPDKKYYTNLVESLGIKNYIKILGFVENINDFYLTMDIFVFPTVWELEGFGLVSVEAMANKIPVIGSDTQPVPEIVEDSKTGIIVKNRDEHAIAIAILKLVNNKKLRNKLGENGYKKVITTYNLDTISKEYISVFYESQLQTNL